MYVAIGAVLAGIAIAVAIAYSITGPLAKATSFAQAIAGGNFDGAIAVDRKDEVGGLPGHPCGKWPTISAACCRTSATLPSVKRRRRRRRPRPSGARPPWNTSARRRRMARQGEEAAAEHRRQEEEAAKERARAEADRSKADELRRKADRLMHVVHSAAAGDSHSDRRGRRR